MHEVLAQWLSSIGLAYAIPRLEAEGFNTAKKLASLVVADYAYLGIADEEDKKKLYLLVQRVKVAIEDTEAQARTHTSQGWDGAHDSSQPPDTDLETSTSSLAEENAAPILHPTPPTVAAPPRMPRRRWSMGSVESFSSERRQSIDQETRNDGQPRASLESYHHVRSATEHHLAYAVDDIQAQPPPPPASTPPPQRTPRTHAQSRARRKSSPMGRGGGAGGWEMANGGGAAAYHQSADTDGFNSLHECQAVTPGFENLQRGEPVHVKSSSVLYGARPQQQPLSLHRAQSHPPPPSANRKRLFEPPPPPPPISSAYAPSLQHVLERPDDGVAIRVVVRKRPLTAWETSKGDLDIVEVGQSHGQVVVLEPRVKVDLTEFTDAHTFAFDDAFDDIVTNEQIYSRTCLPLLASMFRGGRATCFAYGQTGSGKTFTMMGTGREQSRANVGLYELAAADIFQMLSQPCYHHLTPYISFFEIYGGKLFDLLNSRAVVRCLEDSKQRVQFLGLREHPVSEVADLLALIEEGQRIRSTGTTSANADSSRSHAVLQVSLKRTVEVAPVRKTRRAAKQQIPTQQILHGMFSFIDLAGSERGADTRHADKATRLEGADINTSLLALKEVIRALDRKQHHTPFRGSKLTQVLKDSLVGPRARTAMIACIAPNTANVEHTLNTLRYADRVKEHDASRRPYVVAASDVNVNVNVNIQPFVDEETEVTVGVSREEHTSPPSPPPRPPPIITHNVGPTEYITRETAPVGYGGGGGGGHRQASASPRLSMTPPPPPPVDTRAVSEEEIEVYAAELRELRKVTTPTRSSIRRSSTTRTPRATDVSTPRTPSPRAAAVRQSPTARSPHSRPFRWSPSPRMGASPRSSMSSGWGRGRGGGAVRKDGRQCDEAWLDLLTAHGRALGDMAENLKEEMASLGIVEEVDRSLRTPEYVSALERVLADNGRAIETVRDRLQTFKEARAATAVRHVASR